jgi:hypothetical protein
MVQVDHLISLGGWNDVISMIFDLKLWVPNTYVLLGMLFVVIFFLTLQTSSSPTAGPTMLTSQLFRLGLTEGNVLSGLRWSLVHWLAIVGLLQPWELSMCLCKQPCFSSLAIALTQWPTVCLMGAQCPPGAFYTLPHEFSFENSLKCPGNDHNLLILGGN